MLIWIEEKREELLRQDILLNALGVPKKIPGTINDEQIIEITLSDKKAAAGKARYCLPKRIGEMNNFDGAYATFIGEDIVRDALESLR